MPPDSVIAREPNGTSLGAIATEAGVTTHPPVDDAPIVCSVAKKPDSVARSSLSY